MEKSKSIDFTEPTLSLTRSDSIELRKRILTLTQKQAEELGISRSTLHYLRERAESGNSFKIYQKVVKNLEA
jgi:orotate phosphoribosyltransferase-like protein